MLFILGFDFVSALSSLGQLIAAGINAAVQLACGFLDQVGPELRSIAEGIVNGIREAIEAVDWKWVGEVIGRGIKGALSFVAGLLDPSAFYAIGKAIGDFLVGLDWVGIIGGLTEVLARAIGAAVAAVTGFLDSVQPNLKAIADGIVQKINDFVATVDWAELGRTIHDGIDAALDFLLELLDTLDWDSIGQAVVDFLTNLDWGELLIKWGTVVGKALGGALRSIDLSDAIWLGNSIVDGWWRGMLEKWDESGGILGWIKRFLFFPFIDGFKSLFGIHSPSTVMAELGGFLIAGLLQGITETWQGIIDFFREKVEGIKSTLSDAWKDIKTTASQKWDEIKTTISGKWDKIRDTAKQKFSEVRGKIGEAWDNIKRDIPGKLDGIKSAIQTKWNGIVSSAKYWGSDLCGSLARGIEGAAGKVKSAAKTVANKIRSNLHFSEPDEGPLKDFHTYMPDMLALMAKGIRDNTHLAVNAASELADSIANTVSGKSIGVNVDMPDISQFSIPLVAQGAKLPGSREFTMVMQSENGNGESLARMEKLMENMLKRMGNMEIVIHNETNLDGKTVARNTVRHINDFTRSAGRPVIDF